jgi:hypothetical protein
MASKVDKLLLSRDVDRRAVLTEKQVEEIRSLYETGGYTQKALAVKYGVCQSTISYLVSVVAKKTLCEYKQKHPSKRRNRDEAREYVRNLRQYKKTLLKESGGV